MASSFSEISEAARSHRSRGGQVVVIQGIGVVGAAVCAAVASASDGAGQPLHYVIGVDLPGPESYWKVAKLSEGLPPFQSPDRELERVLFASVHTARNLCATTSEEAFGLADVIVVDVNIDVTSHVVDGPSEIHVELDGFRSALRAVGRGMRGDALVLIESTVPIGTCEEVVLPVLNEERRRRGIDSPALLAHAYERVMPGPNYLDSVRAYHRTVAGVNKESAARARAFLSTFIDTETHPLWEFGDTGSSELGKLLENSYRAVNIAFIHEWTLLAEQIGINLFDVVDSIRVRKGTHDNLRYPGFGVGGYCLTKDSLLAQWGATHLLGSDAMLSMTLDALQTNYLMPLHTLDLVKELCDGELEGRRIAVFGVSYLAEVADSRNSPTASLVDRLEKAGADVQVHDPHVRTWTERPGTPIFEDLADALAGAEGVVFGVPHRVYLDLSADELHRNPQGSGFIVDAQNIVSDQKAQALHTGGWRLLGVGKGHWRRRGYHLRA